MESTIPRELLKQQRQVSDEDAADEASWELERFGAARDDGFACFFQWEIDGTSHPKTHKIRGGLFSLSPRNLKGGPMGNVKVVLCGPSFKLQFI